MPGYYCYNNPNPNPRTPRIAGRYRSGGQWLVRASSMKWNTMIVIIYCFHQTVELQFVCSSLMTLMTGAHWPHGCVWSHWPHGCHSSSHLFALMRDAVTSHIMTSSRPAAAAAKWKWTICHERGDSLSKPRKWGRSCNMHGWINFGQNSLSNFCSLEFEGSCIVVSRIAQQFSNATGY